MAQYRLSAAIISRSEGKSIIAAAAYRSADKLLDERTGDLKDYSRRHRSVLYTRILTPENAPVWMQERERLWNGVEHREDRSTKRGTAQLARDIELSLPHELTHEQHVELVCEFVKEEFVDRGMVADIAIHAPPRRGDGTNHHAHILLTMRHIKGDGFGLKNRTWNDDELLEHWRERWEVYENRALEKHGFDERVDHRSLKDQGIDREPTQHLGPAAQAMEDQGLHSDRGDENRRIKASNDNLALLKDELAQSEKRLAELRRQLAVERMEEIQKTIDAIRAPDTVRKADEGRLPEPAPPTPTPRRSRPTAAERIEQIQKTVHAADAFWEPKPPTPPGPEPSPESPAKQAEPEPPAKQPESKQQDPEPPALLPPPPAPSGPAPRRRPPAAYELIAKMKYAERAKEEEEKQAAEREREAERAREEAKERERKPDRDR